MRRSSVPNQSEDSCMNIPSRNSHANCRSIDQEQLECDPSRQHFLTLLNESYKSNSTDASQVGCSILDDVTSVTSAVPFGALHLATLQTDYRTFLCPVCGKVVRGDRQDFRRHYMTHTGEKPVSCPFCLYKTIRKSDMNKHIRSKHEELFLHPTIT